MPSRKLVPPVVTLCLAMVLSGCNGTEPPPPAVTKVLVQPASTRDAAGYAVYTGEIRARHEADLSFRVGGKIASRLVDAGMAVTAGQVLARLDSVEPANPAADPAQVDRLRADLREKLANDLLVEFSSALREQIPVTTDNRAIEALF